MKALFIPSLMVLLFQAFFAFGAVTDQIQVKGKLKAILNDIVILEVKAGDSSRPIKIKKSDIGNLQGLVAGKSILVIQTSFTDFVKLNGAP